MSDKFPRTDTMTCYSYCFCVQYGMRNTACTSNEVAK